MSAPSTTNAALRASGLTKRYGAGETILAGATLALHPGELVVLTAPSGSGKTTLLAILAGLDAPDEGELSIGSPAGIRPPAWRDVALVPQALGLLDELPVDEAVALPLRLGGASRQEERRRVDAVVERLGLAGLAKRFPGELSLGEQQRTAIGRAVVVEPAVLLLDEPTAHQDARSAERILGVLRERAEGGGAVLIASHDDAVVDAGHRVLRLEAGTILDA
jgi:putative ABC transport system ATP-binding protein